MIYELRTYTPHERQFEPMLTRFRDVTMGFFHRYSITSVGYWTAPPEEGSALPRIVYLLAHASPSEAESNWVALANDAEWQAVLAEADTAGPRLAKVEHVYLEPTTFSPLQ